MAAERTLIDSLAYLGDTLIIVSYHVDRTYLTPGSVERHAFYDSTLIPPFVIFNGLHLAQAENIPAYAVLFRQIAEIARTDPEYFTLVIDSVQVDSAQASFDLTIAATFTIPDVDVECFVVILEDSLPGAYGATFYNVCKALYEFPVYIVYPDTFDTTITFDHTIPENRLKAAVFIQDLDSLGIMGATSTAFTMDTIPCYDRFLQINESE